MRGRALGVLDLLLDVHRVIERGPRRRLNDLDGFTGTTTYTLYFGAVTSAWNGSAFRCTVSNAGGIVSSNAAALTVQTVLSDFNHDDKLDLVLQNLTTGARSPKPRLFIGRSTYVNRFTMFDASVSIA